MANNAHSITEQINTTLAGLDLGMDDVAYCNMYQLPRPKRSGRGYTFQLDYLLFFQKSWTTDRVIIHIRGLELVSGDKGAELTKCRQSLNIEIQCATDYDAKRNQYMNTSKTIKVVDSLDNYEGTPRAQAASVLKWARDVEDLFNAKFPR